MRVVLAVCLTLMPLLPVHQLMASESHFHRCGSCLWSFHRVSRLYMECATKFQGMMQVMDARDFSKGPLTRILLGQHVPHGLHGFPFETHTLQLLERAPYNVRHSCQMW